MKIRSLKQFVALTKETYSLALRFKTMRERDAAFRQHTLNEISSLREAIGNLSALQQRQAADLDQALSLLKRPVDKASPKDSTAS